MSSSTWISNRIFSLIHSRNLVYNTCWEDPEIDRQAAVFQPDDDVLVITSAGCNALDYALAGVRSVQTVDVNFRQNALLDLKLSAIRALRYSEFFTLFGEGRHSDAERLYRTTLRPFLIAEESVRYWDKNISIFRGGLFRPTFYYRGSSGLFAAIMRLYLTLKPSLGRHVRAVLDASSLEEQRELYLRELKPRLWGGALRWFVARDTTLAMLGVPRPQRLQIEKQYEGGVVAFIEDCLDAVFAELPLKNNYFYRVYLTGSYTRECCPNYLTEAGFEALQQGAWKRVKFATSTITQFLHSTPQSFSCFILLDHMDWLSQNSVALSEEWSQILLHARPNARFLWRSGGLHTDYLDDLTVRVNGEARPLKSLVDFEQERVRDLHYRDRVHTYGSFYLGERREAA